MWNFPKDFSVNGQMSIFDFQQERNWLNLSDLNRMLEEDTGEGLNPYLSGFLEKKVGSREIVITIGQYKKDGTKFVSVGLWDKKNKSGFGCPCDSYEEVLKYYKKALGKE